MGLMRELMNVLTMNAEHADECDRCIFEEFDWAGLMELMGKGKER